jgi:hypothetical protein
MTEVYENLSTRTTFDFDKIESVLPWRMLQAIKSFETVFLNMKDDMRTEMEYKI